MNRSSCHEWVTGIPVSTTRHPHAEALIFLPFLAIIGPAAIFHRPSKRSALHGQKRAEEAEQDPEQAMNRSRTGLSGTNASYRLVTLLTGVRDADAELIQGT
jgi:hypothetical protein